MQANNTPEKYSYSLEMKPTFPGNIFKFKEYNGLKTIAMFFLLVTLIYFVWSFWGLLTNNYQSYSTLGIPHHRLWLNPFRIIWNSLSQIFHSVLDIFNLMIISAPLILSFFLAWAIFDPRNVAMYILGFTNVFFGLLEIINPIDMIPDIIPLVGSIDDGFLGGGLIGYGLFLLFQANKNKEKIQTIIELMGQHNEEKALKMLLEQQGVSITRVNQD